MFSQLSLGTITNQLKCYLVVPNPTRHFQLVYHFPLLLCWELTSYSRPGTISEAWVLPRGLAFMASARRSTMEHKQFHLASTSDMATLWAGWNMTMPLYSCLEQTKHEGCPSHTWPNSPLPGNVRDDWLLLWQLQLYPHSSSGLPKDKIYWDT